MMANPPPLPGRTRKRGVLRRLPLAFVAMVLFLPLIIPLENWRGRRAWRNSQRDLAARGERLDWNSYIPSPIPDEQNIFKAPHMSEWFVGRDTNELVRMLDAQNFFGFLPHTGSVVVAEVRAVNSETNLNLELVDGLLRWSPGSAIYTRLHLTKTAHLPGAREKIAPAVNNVSGPGSKVIPLVLMENAHLVAPYGISHSMPISNM